MEMAGYPAFFEEKFSFIDPATLHYRSKCFLFLRMQRIITSGQSSCYS
jgi:hypothetical protein